MTILRLPGVSPEPARNRPVTVEQLKVRIAALEAEVARLNDPDQLTARAIRLLNGRCDPA